MMKEMHARARHGGGAAAAATILAFSILLAASAAAKPADPDEWIATRAKIAILSSGSVGVQDLDVHADGGLVVLRGSVATEEERRLAATVVGEVTGVAGVDNQLVVVRESSLPFPGDTWERRGYEVLEAPSDPDREVEEGEQDLIAKVNRALEREGDLEGSSIRAVSVAGGVVLLGGTADLLSQELRAVEVAQGVRGVDGVMSEVFTLDVDEDAYVVPGQESSSAEDRSLEDDREAVERDAQVPLDEDERYEDGPYDDER